jgi:hypothetical protein
MHGQYHPCYAHKGFSFNRRGTLHRCPEGNPPTKERVGGSAFPLFAPKCESLAKRLCLAQTTYLESITYEYRAFPSG